MQKRDLTSAKLMHKFSILQAMTVIGISALVVTMLLRCL